MAESSGPAPQASRPETASNRSPRFAVLLSEKMADARGHAPHPAHAGPIRFKRLSRLAGFRFRKVPAAGFAVSANSRPRACRGAPASIRLEGGGLSFSATRRWSAGARKWRSPSKARVSRAGARLRAVRRTKWTSRRSAGQQNTHNTAFEAPHDRNFTTRGRKWSLHEELHLDLELRGLASCLLDDEGKNGVPPTRNSGR